MLLDNALLAIKVQYERCIVEQSNSTEFCKVSYNSGALPKRERERGTVQCCTTMTEYKVFIP